MYSWPFILNIFKKLGLEKRKNLTIFKSFLQRAIIVKSKDASVNPNKAMYRAKLSCM